MAKPVDPARKATAVKMRPYIRDFLRPETTRAAELYLENLWKEVG
jgi:hypothetical protein